MQIDQQGNIVQPSLAFCQALDNEQEYDEVDDVAGTSLRGTADPADTKPNRFTEVCALHMLQYQRSLQGLCMGRNLEDYSGWLKAA